MVSLQERVQRWAVIQKYILPVPEIWLLEAQDSKDRKSRVSIEECTSWEELVKVWKDALVWTDELNGALACMLACVLSTRYKKDQLWMKFISVASSGKTTLAEAISTCREYVYPKDFVTKFYTGTRPMKGRPDPSIIPKIKDKTFIIKDGDGLLQAPDRATILAQIRGLYDTSGRSHYNTHVDRNYENVRFSFILCGTPTLRQLDNSELGERFLDYVIMEKIVRKHEIAIGHKTAWEVINCRGVEANGTADGQETPAMLKAKAYTGGFVKYLRDHAASIRASVRPLDEQVHKCCRYGDFVSHMRAKMDKSKDPAEVFRELSSRLIAQHTKLAVCLAGVMGHDSFSPEIMKIVNKVAMDSSRGKPLEIVRYIAKGKNKGECEESIRITINQSEYMTHQYLLHLERNEVLHRASNGYQTVWRLRPAFRELYNEVK